MGFLDGLLSTVGGILGLVGGPVGAGVGASLGSTAASLLQGGGVPTASQQIGVTAATIVGGPIAGGIQAGVSSAVSGRMKNRVQTIIQTIAPDGSVIRQKVLEGAPFLMQKDFQIARRVIKLSAKAAAKIPKKRIAETVASALKKAIETRALAEVTNGHPNGGPIQLTAPLTSG